MDEAKESKKKNIPPVGDGSAPFSKGELRANFNAWALAWELGYTIAIPIVALALVGRWADKAWETSPWMLLAGVVVSVVVSSALVYRKVSRIIR